MSALRFLLNGEKRVEDRIPPTMTVLDWLRGVARLTGTKEGCAEGDCGACTIVVGRLNDGAMRYEAVNSCLMMMPQIDNCALRTIEGVSGADGALHPIQQAMVETDGTQCGFCTPGFVMAMLAFAQRSDDAVNDGDIHEAIAGNLCRCTGYRAIVDAARRVVGQSGLERHRDAEADALRRMTSDSAYAHAEQEFFAPQSLDELLALKAQYPDALVLGGGTDLGLRVSKGREALPCVISTARVLELKTITSGDLALRDAALRSAPQGEVGFHPEEFAQRASRRITIGGGVTYTGALPAIEQHFPSFGALIRRIGSPQIRNLGTLAGNLATASPIGDTLPCLVALDASVRLQSIRGQRTMPIESFILGYRKTALAPDEIITAIHVPLLTPSQTFLTYKVSKRFDQDIATLIAAFRLDRDGGRVRELRAAFGGMADRVKRAKTLEDGVKGRAWTAEKLGDIDAMIAHDFQPISDQRGGAAYRLRAAAGLVRRFHIETTSDVATKLEAL